MVLCFLRDVVSLKYNIKKLAGLQLSCRGCVLEWDKSGIIRQVLN
jgi:hypothetical protein